MAGLIDRIGAQLVAQNSHPSAKPTKLPVDNLHRLLCHSEPRERDTAQVQCGWEQLKRTSGGGLHSMELFFGLASAPMWWSIASG